MTDTTYREPDASLVTITTVTYALHALGLAIGAFGTASVVGAFLFGWPSIIAVIINYVKRDEARGTWLESHVTWQIRTFWFALLWIAVSALMVVTIIGVPFALALLLIAGLWILYRVVRGWWNLMQRQTMPMA